MRLEGKIALITGGGSGIGLATARAFCREGAKTLLFGRRTDRLQSAVQELGPQAQAVTGDMTRNEDLDRLIKTAMDTHGRIDIVVNNAGAFSGAPLHEMEEAQWNDTMDLNISSVFRLTQRALKPMIAQKSGNFLHISSILGMIAVPQVAAYNASKGALIQFSRSIAMEYGALGIRSNAICPGLIETEMTADLMADKELMAIWAKDYPIGRFGKAEDVANACLYLASDESAFVTGVVLPVDGGFTAH
ncbi:MAG: 2-hydroxypropyl-CoM dehydrogenase [Nitrospinae bacterium CG11_big_fil_rev_8_21_14_0_20_45_15]|nr:MAG: 2-hydroxypropyl-CoM dehydrogenase [Nitrospinae bacterium CG11_big_fil_rev_8_21_14_0_20_45_15]